MKHIKKIEDFFDISLRRYNTSQQKSTAKTMSFKNLRVTLDNIRISKQDVDNLTKKQ